MIVLHSVGVTATGAERHLLSGQWLLQGREKAKMEIYVWMVVTNKKREWIKGRVKASTATINMTSRPSRSIRTCKSAGLHNDTEIYTYYM